LKKAMKSFSPIRSTKTSSKLTWNGGQKLRLRKGRESFIIEWVG